MTINTVIVEDEPLARAIIKDYLREDPTFSVVAEYDNGFDALRGIQENMPDLVLLDVQMPKLTGIEMLELLEEKPNIIFTTAYDEYAIHAFDQNAVDYLLKPFSKDRFIESLTRAKERIQNAEKPPELPDLAELTMPKDHLISRIVVKTGNHINIIQADEIDYLEAQDDYVMIYSGEQKFLKQSRMKFYEENLDPNQFLRIHRSYIVKLDQIDKIDLYDKEGYLVTLKGGAKIQASKSGYSRLKSTLNF